MKILMITPEYHPKNTGGGGIVYRILSRELRKQGHAVTVLAGDFHNKKLLGRIGYMNDHGVDVFFLPLIPAPKVRNISLATSMPPTLLAFIFLVRKLAESSYEIIHVHGVGHALIDIACLLCIIFRKKYVFTCHGIPKGPETVWFVFRQLFRAYLAMLEKFVTRKAKALTAVSRMLLSECIAKGLTNKKMFAIPNGPNILLEMINREKISRLTEEIKEKYSLANKMLIFSIGRLAQSKGFQYLIEAMSDVTSRIQNVVAIIAGEGPYRSTLEKLIDERKLQDYVKLVGWISDEEKVAFYEIADVVVVPSIYEPFGIVVLEALAMNKPVIAFDIPPISEVISDGVNGFKVPLGDTKALADAIIKLLSGYKMDRQTFSNNYLQWSEIAQKYLKIYRECCTLT